VDEVTVKPPVPEAEDVVMVVKPEGEELVTGELRELLGVGGEDVAPEGLKEEAVGGELLEGVLEEVVPDRLKEDVVVGKPPDGVLEKVAEGVLVGKVREPESEMGVEEEE